MLSLPGGCDSLDERSDRSVSHQCRSTSLSGQTRPSKGATTETTWWKVFAAIDASGRHRTQETFRGWSREKTCHLVDYSAQLVKSIEKITDVGRDICQPLKLKSWDVFLHESRGPADEYIKKIQSM